MMWWHDMTTEASNISWHCNPNPNPGHWLPYMSRFVEDIQIPAQWSNSLVMQFSEWTSAMKWGMNVFCMRHITNHVICKWLSINVMISSFEPIYSPVEYIKLDLLGNRISENRLKKIARRHQTLLGNWQDSLKIFPLKYQTVMWPYGKLRWRYLNGVYVLFI